MKRIIALILASVLLLSGCRSVIKPKSTPEQASQNDSADIIPAFSGLNDVHLLDYTEDSLYSDLISAFNSDDYFVENVAAVYISKEYLEEIEYNSKENVLFGYTISELSNCFQGAKYVFTVDENGETVVSEFQNYDDTYDKIIRNVAIGTGVIFVCITVSFVTGGTLPAVSLIFAASAKSSAVFSLKSSALSGTAAGIIKYIETGSINDALKQAALSASDGFKFGAIFGAIGGGLKEASALKGATLNGLTVNEAAEIQKESKQSLEFIKNYHSYEEYQVYKEARLNVSVVDGNQALIQPIDWNYIGEDGRTNWQRVMDNLSPLDPQGQPYELHHIGQKNDSPLAILTSEQHKSNYSTLHKNTGTSSSEIDRVGFEKIKNEFWKAYYAATK